MPGNPVRHFLLCGFAALLLFSAGNEHVEARLEVPRLADAPPPSREKRRAAMQRGVNFLLQNQNSDGSWGKYLKTLSDPVMCPAPGGPLSFRIATTSLDIMALLEAAPGDPRAEQAAEKATEWLMRELPRLRRPGISVLYNIWGHAYALQALSAMALLHHDQPEQVARYKKAAKEQLERLAVFSNLKGGWGYYEFNDATARPSCFSMSFTTAAVLTAMSDAETRFGLKPDERVRSRAVALLKRLRTPEGTYLYGDHLKGIAEGMLTSRHMGSLGRTVACNYALSQWDTAFASLLTLEEGLEWMWARNGWMLLAKKWPIPHESYAKNAGYFAFFGYYYAGRTLEKLPASHRTRHAALLANIILPQQEPAGCWWDFPMMDYHRQYGTGFALLALARAEKCLERQTPVSPLPGHPDSMNGGSSLTGRE